MTLDTGFFPAKRAGWLVGWLPTGLSVCLPAEIIQKFGLIGGY